MKYVVVLGDGMADLPLEELNGKTPLEAANTENMDFIASHGKSGMLKTLVRGMPIGSEVANLSILGYSPEKYYPGGRGPLEAPCMGVTLRNREIAVRTNFVNAENGILKHYSAGEISTEEGKILTEELNKKLGNEEIRFYQGKEYRGLLALTSRHSEKVKCWPPHEINDKRIGDYLPKPTEKTAGKTAELLTKLTLESEKILSKNRINKKRISRGKEPANMLWFWGIGRYKEMPNFREKFKISGAMISAVTLLKGIGFSIGLSVPEVSGATANMKTNYEGKVKCALKELKQKDFVYVHIKAPDDLSHNGDFENKIRAIEHIDKRIIGRILNSLTGKENFKIAILPDHTTSTELRKHTLDPVPFAVYSPEEKPDSVKEYGEKAARQGFYGLQNGTDFMKILLGNGDKKH